jgi:phosphoenolpyruvate carboxylase
MTVMFALARDSRDFYRLHVQDDDAMRRFFSQATPFPELATLNLASRPVSRATAAQAVPRLEDLRAIPWGFSWTQARMNLPGWFGLGHALQLQIERGGVDHLREMYATWPFFASLIDNTQLSLATSDLATARAYAGLADDQEPLRIIEEEMERTRESVLQVSGQSRLLAGSPVLARSILLRNPYVDVLHGVQIELVRRYRALGQSGIDASNTGLIDALHHSVNGIAAGLQTTG